MRENECFYDWHCRFRFGYYRKRINILLKNRNKHTSSKQSRIAGSLMLEFDFLPFVSKEEHFIISR